MAINDLISRKALLEKAVEVPGYISKMVSSYDIAEAKAVEVEPVKYSELTKPYLDEYFGEFARCNSCDAENIVPSRFCRWCGAKLSDFEKYPENY